MLLVEPSYPNKYPPLGLMKLAAYHRDRGDNVRFVKGEPRGGAVRGVGPSIRHYSVQLRMEPDLEGDRLRDTSGRRAA